MRAVTIYCREEVIRLTNLHELHTEAIPDEMTCIGLDPHDNGLYDKIKKDIHQSPTRGIFRRRGEYTFVIKTANCVLGVFDTFKHRLESKVVLDPNDSFLTLEKLQKIASIACRDTGLTLVSVLPKNQGAVTYFEYTISY